MSTEKQMWAALQPYMKRAKLDPHRVENRVSVGMPDVNYLHGWLELKNADEFQRIGTLALKHPPTPEQKVWLERRHNLGGVVFLCLRVGRKWWLIEGDKVKELWPNKNSRPTKEQIKYWSVCEGDKPADIADFLVGYGNGA
ncbi:MAG: hypothetical protein [Bacteriophage sp.]|nr:MAG: hypothetical protein [Bacteriophage sp.]